MILSPARGGMVVGERRPMSQTVRFQETLRRLAMIDEGFVEDDAGLGLGLARTSALDPKTAALLHVAVLVAIGSPAVCLEWSAGRARERGRDRRRAAGDRPGRRARPGRSRRPRSGDRARL